MLEREASTKVAAEGGRGLLTLCLLVLGGFYLVLLNSYRAYEIDNPWYLSFSRNWLVDRYSKDFFLNGVFPDGMGGTPVFGRLAALMQGAILSHTGWNPVPATALSVLIVIVGLGIWTDFLRKEGFSVTAACGMVFALGLTEPFVGMAERFRFEPYSFMLMALAFWLGARRQAWIALCVGLLALEIEPVAVLVFPSVAFYLVRCRLASVRQVLYGSLLAGTLFAVVYGVLHPDVLATLRQTDWHHGSGQKQMGGFLGGYFIVRKRHLPELALVAVVVWIYGWWRGEAPIFVRCMAELTGFVCIISFLMRWPTPAYMAFFFPVFLVVAQWSMGRYEWRGWALAGVVAVLMIPQYGVLAVLNWGEGWRSKDLRQISDLIKYSEQVEGLDDAQVQVMGDYSLWFAHPERYRALARTTSNLLPGEGLFLCFEGPLRPPSMVDPIVQYCGDVRARIAVRAVESVKLRGHQLTVLVPR